MILKDLDLASICIYCEAWLEPDEGKAAVARVLRNRINKLYESDGTMQGTVLKYDQFSWAWFAYVNGKYTRISDNQHMAYSVAEFKLKHAPAFALSRCAQIYIAVKNGEFKGDLYNKLTDEAVLYLNPHIVEHMPVWADPALLVATIGNHNFYKAGESK